MQRPNLLAIHAFRPAWNKGRIVGQKQPLKPQHVWAIRVGLELAENDRDLAHFNLAIDNKLRGCDLVKLKFIDARSELNYLYHGCGHGADTVYGHVKPRAGRVVSHFNVFFSGFGNWI